MKQAVRHMTIECIDGKDDRLVIPFGDDNQIILGKHPEKQSHPLQGLKEEEGFIICTREGSYMSIDATSSKAIVKVNGKPINQAQALSYIDIIRIGEDIWRINVEEDKMSPSHPLLKHADKDSITGLEDLNSMDMKTIMSEVFKKKSYQDMEDQLLTGTSRFQPNILDIEVSWAKPWLFARFMIFSIILGIGFYIMFNGLDNIYALPGLIFVSTFAIPLSTLLFFMEMNTPRNVSIFNIMIGLFSGGCVSLFISLILFDKMNYLSFLGASQAGIIEEIGKLLTVIILFVRFKSFKWIHNGLLFGATVGCGFEAFESAGYVLKLFLQNKDSLSFMIIHRSVTAPFAHIIWTGNAAAALWMVKSDRNFKMSMLFDKRFLRIFLTSMALHMAWNAPFSVYPLPYVIDVKFLLLGFIGISISFKLIQSGLKQIIEERKTITGKLAAE